MFDLRYNCTCLIFLSVNQMRVEYLRVNNACIYNNDLYSMETEAQRKVTPNNTIVQTNIVCLSDFFTSKFHSLLYYSILNKTMKKY